MKEQPGNIAARSAYAFSLNEIRKLVWEDCQWRSSPGEIRLDPSLAKRSKAHRAAVTLPSSSQAATAREPSSANGRCSKV